MDTIESMRTFAAVAQAGSFSAAARRLGISKALASKQVGMLERRLGACLFQRTTRAVTLTDAGRDALARCLDILAAVDDLENEAASAHGEVCGTLRVAGPPLLGEEVLAPAVASFVRRHPSVRVELALEERFVDVVGEGFDLAIRVGDLTDSGLVARRIGTQRFVLCAARAYLARKGTPRRPEELAQHDCIVDLALSPTARWHVGGKRGAQVVAVRPRVRVSSARAVATLVRAGVGVGLVATSLVRDDLASGRVVQLLGEDAVYERDVWAIHPHPHRSQVPARVRAFLEHLSEALRSACAPAPRPGRGSRRQAHVEGGVRAARSTGRAARSTG
ncbi:MAG TPA: LysR family transcriptional regulator [Candidatus Binatia bacterium]